VRGHSACGPDAGGGELTVSRPLVDVEELAPLLASAVGASAGPTLLDVRWRLGGPPGIDGFRAGHLRGAVFADLERDLSGPVLPDGRGGRHPLPAPEAAQAALRRLGVSGQRAVVVYDEADGTSAARAWWLLRYLGHDDVRLLDGGLAAWTAAGHPVESGDSPVPAPGDLVVRPGAMPLLDAAAAGALARDGVLLDARAAERFRGETEPVDPVAGHVPGAVSAPTTANVDGAGRFLAPGDLRARFAGLGVVGRDVAGLGLAAPEEEGAEPVGAYCGSGVTAAHTVLALELAGVRAALYAGSWSDWVSHPARPVATGEA
jgi:thiosulfate/3-mercaptopyruvate sulfurtransferase